MKIDRSELEKQRREAVLKSDEYALCEIIMPKGMDEQPLTRFKAHHVGPLEIAKLINTLEELTKNLKDRHPLEAILSNMFKCETAEVIDGTKENIVDIDESEG